MLQRLFTIMLIGFFTQQVSAKELPDFTELVPTDQRPGDLCEGRLQG